MKRLLLIQLLICFAVMSAVSMADAADWPMWRYDAARSADSPERLPDTLHLLWVRQQLPREPVWDDPLNHDLMPFDRIFEPVVTGSVMILGFNDTDKLVGIDTATGEELWRYYTGGPVRLAPAAYDGRVYATSDDGCLYCLNAETGRLVWKFRGGPTGRKVLGNKRLISMWPARGGVVVKDGRVYFAASIWPFMGTFIYALDAGTGDIVWKNDGNGSEFMRQPHNAPSFAGVAPQGSLVIDGDNLLIPGGRSVPAVFDRTTGKMKYYRLAESGKTGGAFVAAAGDVFFNHYRERVTTMYDMKSGMPVVSNVGSYPVITGDTWYFSGKGITAMDAGWVADGIDEWTASGKIKQSELVNRARTRAAEKTRWIVNVDASGDLIRSGGRLYAAGDGFITAVDTNASGGEPRIAWKQRVDAEVERLLAADGKLFAVTLDGRIMAFGAEKAAPKMHLDHPSIADISKVAADKALAIINQTGIDDGYALLYGSDNAELAQALANLTSLHIVVADTDERALEGARRKLDDAGLYGGRVAALTGCPATLRAPQYFASLTIVTDTKDVTKKTVGDFVTGVFHSMRPYGGTAWIEADERNAKLIADAVDRRRFPGLKVERLEGRILLRREGPLPGAGIWTHNYGTPSNTAKSDDELVRLPLGLLWFGGNSNLDVLPRHGHGPGEQIVGGRLFIQGLSCLSARDVYTGRVLWKRELLDLETYNIYYNHTYKDAPTNTRYNQVHLPGANIRGTNFIATFDRVYILQNADCLALDAKTGETVDVFRLPAIDPEAKKPKYPDWAYIGVSGDYLIGGTGFVPFSDILGRKKEEYSIWEDFDTAASRGLAVMNRYTGELLWKADADTGFLHNSIAIGDGRLFCLDKLPPFMADMLSRRGKTSDETGRLIAFDLDSGAVAWDDTAAVFGSFLSYSKEHGLLVQSTRPSRDMVHGEDGKRMAAFRAQTGGIVWDKLLEYKTFPILHGQKLITEGQVYNLLTGDKLTRTDPITGREVSWTWKRNYGCNYPVASEHLLTFRSGAAGFFDLDSLGGTGNFGGFKSGCSINLIAADGVLNAPDYTRTCSCPYQNQTSLAMAYMPDADIEIWTFDTVEYDGSPVRRAGLNFGAPGNRVDGDGTLWLDWPSVGGESPDIPVTTFPEEAKTYRFHASRITGDSHRWVASSGLIGTERITLQLSAELMKERAYTVRLYFAEPGYAGPGERVFDVAVQGKKRLKKLDIAAEKGTDTLLVKEIRGVRTTRDIVIDLKEIASSRYPSVISGIEIIGD